MKRQLILEDGTTFVGEALGSDILTSGEVVFNTGMTGYQEILSDPSYCGQIVTLTYPLIGNYGINREDFETINPSVSGLIVKEACSHPSNFRSEDTIHDYLKARGIPGITGVDTRKLTKKIREFGTMKGAFASVEESPEEVAASLRDEQFSTDQVKKVSTVKPYVVPGRGERIVLVDFGMKHGILREFTKRNSHVTVVPYNTTAEEIMQLKPDGVMLSNGPGDPKDVPEAVEMVQGLLGRIPLFGICLGHQLFALACGADTSKMKFGHRGSNHPVKDIATGRVYMTSQNHGYAVEEDSIKETELQISQYALNDGTVEGLFHPNFSAFSVQYHPESAPGPEDSNGLFDEFLLAVKRDKRRERVVCQSVQI
ncbi:MULTISPECIES: carbamoyl phosphate synthase small subunit [Pontibacillus]|uniref:Carbamoyl phosphate synthase small chain n=1 Tax=Pontibacillus chungwhensis TaxID=265426 RepID=A0ABY8V4W7_9BACI|nr:MULTISPECIES: carbamoyl phosphate synthase small subunit [Pontibacillus]MCD5322616.1 carbamoyl phosphate synthase small subunit [Pontibacillus sp. HN14]WIF99899.1 carbamoyl phosphate synthase small subunit [Pontibacillus chungwhensis]